MDRIVFDLGRISKWNAKRYYFWTNYTARNRRFTSLVISTLLLGSLVPLRMVTYKMSNIFLFLVEKIYPKFNTETTLKVVTINLQPFITWSFVSLYYENWASWILMMNSSQTPLVYGASDDLVDQEKTFIEVSRNESFDLFHVASSSNSKNQKLKGSLSFATMTF